MPDMTLGYMGYAGSAQAGAGVSWLITRWPMGHQSPLSQAPHWASNLKF